MMKKNKPITSEEENARVAIYEEFDYLKAAMANEIIRLRKELKLLRLTMERHD